MRRYILSRLASSLVTLVGAAILIFFMIRVAPGDIALQILGETNSDPEKYQELREELGLDRPQLVQFGSWVSDAARGDLGESLWNGRSVTDVIWDRLPVTIELAILTIVMATGMGLSLGIVSAVSRGSVIDYAARIFSLTGLSLPGFWVGTLFLLFCSRWLGWAPPLTYVPITEDPVKNLQQFIPAALVLSLYISAIIARMTRSSLLEVLRADYIRTAEAKGLAYKVVVLRHAIANSLIPVVTVSGLLLGSLLGGSVIAETLFNLPGLGRLLIESVAVRDYPVVQGVTMFGVLSVLVVTLLVDLSYALIDPRIRYGVSD